jgi:gamma-glutamylcysteine synthetase
MNLVGKIQAMEAMDLRGIEQSMVEKVMLDYEEGMEKFKESVHAGDGVTKKKEDVLSAKDKEELRKLEAEIMGESEKTSTRKNTEAFSDEALAELEAELMQNERERKEAAKEFDVEAQDSEPELE